MLQTERVRLGEPQGLHQRLELVEQPLHRPQIRRGEVRARRAEQQRRRLRGAPSRAQVAPQPLRAGCMEGIDGPRRPQVHAFERLLEERRGGGVVAFDPPRLISPAQQHLAHQPVLEGPAHRRPPLGRARQSGVEELVHQRIRRLDAPPGTQGSPLLGEDVLAQHCSQLERHLSVLAAPGQDALDALLPHLPEIRGHRRADALSQTDARRPWLEEAAAHPVRDEVGGEQRAARRAGVHLRGQLGLELEQRPDERLPMLRRERADLQRVHAAPPEDLVEQRRLERRLVERLVARGHDDEDGASGLHPRI